MLNVISTCRDILCVDINVDKRCVDHSTSTDVIVVDVPCYRLLQMYTHTHNKQFQIPVCNVVPLNTFDHGPSPPMENALALTLYSTLGSNPVTRIASVASPSTGITSLLSMLVNSILYCQSCHTPRPVTANTTFVLRRKIQC